MMVVEQKTNKRPEVRRNAVNRGDVFLYADTVCMAYGETGAVDLADGDVYTISPTAFVTPVDATLTWSFKQ